MSNPEIAAVEERDPWLSSVGLTDVLALTRTIVDGGGQARLTQCEGAIHVYPVLPTPEGKVATREIVASLVDPSRR